LLLSRLRVDDALLGAAALFLHFALYLLRLLLLILLQFALLLLLLDLHLRLHTLLAWIVARLIRLISVVQHISHAAKGQQRGKDD